MKKFCFLLILCLSIFMSINVVNAQTCEYNLRNENTNLDFNTYTCNIIEIDDGKDYEVSCRFNNGKSDTHQYPIATLKSFYKNNHSCPKYIVYLDADKALNDYIVSFHNTEKEAQKRVEHFKKDYDSVYIFDLLGNDTTDSGNSLYNENIGDNVCSNGNVQNALRMVGYFIFLAKLFVPLLIIGFGSFDLYKSILNGGGESMSKQLKSLGFRVIAGIVVFFIPTIVNAFLGQLVAMQGISDEITGCQVCLLDPFNCHPKQENYDTTNQESTTTHIRVTTHTGDSDENHGGGGVRR